MARPSLARSLLETSALRFLEREACRETAPFWWPKKELPGERAEQEQGGEVKSGRLLRESEGKSEVVQLKEGVWEGTVAGAKTGV